MEDGLSSRGECTATHKDFLGKYMFAAMDDPYSPQNPQGIVNLGTAENRSCEDTLAKKLNEIGVVFEPWMLQYFKYHGIDSVREAAATFIERYFHAKHVDPEQLVMFLGTCSIFDCVGHAVAEPGDVFLVPAPYYTRTQNDLHERALVNTFNVPLSANPEEGETGPFELNLRRVEKAYNNAISEGKRVRGIVLINPHNPTGMVFPQKNLLPIMEFMKKKNLWVLIDEIYGLSAFDSSANFQSVLSWDYVPDPQKTLWFWGLSKDFAMPGMRCSFVTSLAPNPSLLACLRQLTIYQCVPVVLHPLIQKLLLSFDWMEKIYFPENLRKITENYQLVKDRLASINVPIAPATAGFFVYADFRKRMKDVTFEEEMDLFLRFFKEGVNIVPGKQLFSSEPGWFRIVFSVRKDVLIRGLDRIESVLNT